MDILETNQTINSCHLSIDTFQKYKNILLKTNKKPEELTEYEFTDNEKELSSKIKKIDIFNNPEIKANLNFRINKKNISEDDKVLYNYITSNLNKINDNNFMEILEELIKLPYIKAKHFYKLAELVVVKSIKEPNYARRYAELLFNLIELSIEVNNDKVCFKKFLLTICEDIFNELLFDSKYDIPIKKIYEYEREMSYNKLNLSGFNNLFGELYKLNVISHSCICFCFEKLINCIDRGSYYDNLYEGLKVLYQTCIKTIKTTNIQNYNEIRGRIVNLSNLNKFSNVKQKFNLLEIIEFE
jgi:hypothetical protein